MLLVGFGVNLCLYEYEDVINVVCNEPCYKLSLVNTIDSLSKGDVKKMQSYCYLNSDIYIDCNFCFGHKVP